MYKTSKNVKSTLTYGTQWDTMLQWLIDSGEKTSDEVITNSINWGNYYSSTVTGNDGTTLKNANTGTLLNTGITEYTIANNIYDIAGNLGEFTMEKVGTSTLNIYRGNEYDYNYSTSIMNSVIRRSAGMTSKIRNIGFRPSLYIKVETDEITITPDITTPRNTTFTGDNNGVAAGPITVTITFGNTALINNNKYQYKIGEDGEWQVSEGKVKVIEVTENCTIYARYFTGEEGFQTKTYTISNVDNIPPVNFEVDTFNSTEIGIVVDAITVDEEFEVEYYIYNVNDVQYRVGKDEFKQFYTITNVEPNTEYTILVEAYDTAGNKVVSTNTEKITTWNPTTYAWNETKQVNKPEVTEGMIPIKYNGENWVITTQEDEEWYSYEAIEGTNYTSKWANVMLSDGTYKYDTAEAGTIVQEEELGSMFVWIPRYAYKIESGYHTNTAGEISIEFLEGTSSHKTGVEIGSYPEYSYSTTAADSKMLNYVVHPAFNYDETQLTGLWIAKFRASREDATSSSVGTSDKLKVVGNKYAWHSGTVSQYYTASVNMNSEGNIYGLISNDEIVDPHLMKNSEWGAMTYLTHSKYGTNKKEVKEETSGITKAQYIKTPEYSSTQNIYGLYDINGTGHYVSAYINNGNNYLTTNASELLTAPNKHKDIYEVGKIGNILSYTLSDTSNDNYAISKNKYGDGIYETSSQNGYYYTWQSGNMYYPFVSYPIFLKGLANGSYYSIFSTDNSSGTASSSYYFRPVIAVIDQYPEKNIQITADVTTPRNTTFTGDNNGVEAGLITVTINYGETELQKQYKQGIDGAWTTVSKNTAQISVIKNETIYARYYDGTNGIRTRSYTVSNVDNTNPENFTAYTNYVAGTGIEISGYTTDNKTEEVTYKYYLDNNLIGTSKEKNYTGSLDTTKTNTAYMEAQDEAGNITKSNTIEILAGITENYKWSTAKQVNKPEVTEGMIPIKYNGENWEITTQEDEEWYSYEAVEGTNYTSKWANVMLSDGTYKYDTAEAGTIVQEEELGSMFVWIPRYAYKIESGYHKNAAGEISIEFLEGTSSNKTGVDIGSYPEYSYSTTSASDSKMLNYVVHPAFNYDKIQLTGLWIAKFRASREDATSSSVGKNENIKVVGNKYAWNSGTVSQYYTTSVNMNSKENIYGLITNDNAVDPHLMKNSEWGAVTYLTHSKYGTNQKEINYNTGTTTGANYTKTTTPSSTQNIYGIYDFNGTGHYVAAYINNGHEYLTTYASELLTAPNKHKDVYEVGRTGSILSYNISDTSSDNYSQIEKSKYGDAIYETSSKNEGNSYTSFYNCCVWQDGYTKYPYSSYPIFKRGEYYNISSKYYYSIFSFSGATGSSSSNYYFRPVIAVIDQYPENNIEITADVATPRNTTFTGDNNGVEAGPITVTINYGETELQKQYKEGIDEKWIIVNESTAQISVTQNETIYARYYDGTKGIKSTTYTIENVDNTNPEFSTQYVESDDNAYIFIKDITDDNETKYYFSIDNEANWIETNKLENMTQKNLTGIYQVKLLDKAGNQTIKESRKKEGEILTAKLIDPSKHYGKFVNYVPSNGIEIGWKIFHSDGTNIYLIADDYINKTDAPKKNGQSPAYNNDNYPYGVDFREIYKQYTGTKDINIKNLAYKWIRWIKWIGTYPPTENINIKSVAYLMDTEIWSGYKDVNNKALYAIGGPTLEMYIESWNAKGYTKLYYDNWNNNGYYIGTNSIPTTTEVNISGTSGYNDILYYPHKTHVNNCHGYWIASPSSNYNDYIMHNGCDGSINGLNYDNYYCGIRPVICLNPGNQLITLDGGETYEIVERVPDAEISGIITYSKPIWNNKQAEITISTDTKYKIEYQVNSTEGIWIQAEQTGTSITVTGLMQNDVLYVRLTDGIDTGNYTSLTITEGIRVTAYDIGDETDKSIYYGKKVNYSPSNGAEVGWKIFHSDGTNIYLITDYYIKSIYAPKKNGQSPSEGVYTTNLYNVSRQYTGTADIGTRHPAYKWTNLIKYYSTSENKKAVAYLMDTEIWSNFKDINNKALYVIGGPTLQMYVESWNAMEYTKLYCNNTDIKGYYVGTNPQPTTASVDVSKTSGYDNILYYPHKTFENDCQGYWIASPSAYEATNLIMNSYGGMISFKGYNYIGNALRPVVCLNSDVQLITYDDGQTYDIVE